jgi:ribonucleoside-diphosphate reductase alpha chain
MMRVLKRDNTYEPISFDKVLRRIRNLCQNLKGVSADEIAQKVCARIYDGVKTSELDELAAQLCASLLTTHPDYGFLASRIIISNHHKNTSPSFSETMGLLFNAKDIHGVQNALISQELWDIVKTHKTKLNSVIDYQRDFLFDYFGFKTLERSYLLKVDGKIVERPQHMWMRVALGIHGSDIKEALETYDYMSQRYFTHATPTLFNAGTPRAQLASCFLLGTHDSITGIFKTVTDSAQISKYAGGIGIHIHDIRACGSYIRGTNGNSTGIIPMLRVYNNTARYVNQCFKGDTIVYTKNGIKQMDQVSENDNLITHDGTFKNVLGISRNFIKKQILTIKITHAMENVDVTKEHQIYTIRNQALMLNYSTIRKRLEAKTIAPEYCDAKELKKGDFVGFPIPKYIQDHSETMDFFRFYGILIGDGHVCANRNEYGLTLGFNKSATFEFAKTFLEKRGIHTWFAKDTSKHTNMIRWSGNVDKLPIPREDVYIEKIKNIPAKYLHLPEDKTMAIIQGLLETDGSILGEVMFFNTSKNVVYSLRYMLLRLGILTSGNLKKCEGKSHIIINKHGKECTIISNKDCYNLRIPKHPKFKTIMGDTIEYSSTVKYFEYDNILWSRIKTVTEKNYEGYVYDFNMCDNHNYMTDMGLVHNSGKRNGSIAMYLEPWHADIEAFLDIRKNHGSEEDRCRDLFTAMWIPDLFMKRVQENGDWSLMCPDESRGLSDAVGEEFEALYQKYETEGKFRKKIKAQQLWMAILKSQIETGTPYLCYKDAANKKTNQKNLGTIKSSNLCSEILEYSNQSSYATCNLASIALPSYIEYEEETGVPFYNFKKLHQIAQVITRNINKVIDRTFYPVPETESNNKQHRPIGIGVQGLANTFALMRLPFDSPEAAQLNKDIFETIYHGALTASMLIAKRREEMRTELETPGIVLKRKRELIKYLQLIPEETALTKYRGAYSSFEGSPASQGLLQFDLWGVAPGGVLWNWEELKGEIAKYGIRNSLLLAPMPTASTSQILGFNESIEPFTSNIYQRQTLAGEFVIINKHLIQDLLDAGLWNPEMKNRVFMAGGSIQGILEIPENIRELYKTAWEMKQKVLIDQAADRGIYVCQSQSLNLFVEDPEFSKLSNMHFYGWKRGLKTGVYYLRTRPRAKITAFTIEPPKLLNTTSSQDIGEVIGSSNVNSNPTSSRLTSPNPSPKREPAEIPTEEQIMACRLDNPEGCLMCGS